MNIARALICFITPPFSYTKMSVRISGIGWCYSKLNVLFKISRKMIWGEETFFCNLNETLLSISKHRMEACPQMNYDLVFQSKQGQSCFNITKSFAKEIIINFTKLCLKIGLGLFWEKPIRCRQPQTKVCDCFANYELYINYRDFGTWVSRW